MYLNISVRLLPEAKYLHGVSVQAKDNVLRECYVRECYVRVCVRESL